MNVKYKICSLFDPLSIPVEKNREKSQNRIYTFFITPCIIPKKQFSAFFCIYITCLTLFTISKRKKMKFTSNKKVDFRLWPKFSSILMKNRFFILKFFPRDFSNYIQTVPNVFFEALSDGKNHFSKT